jgi:hypothetical protein
MACGKSLAVAVGLAIGLPSSRPAHALCNSGLQRKTMSETRSRASARWLYDAQVREARRARVWRYAWTGINGTLAVGSVALIPFTSSEKHLELAVSGVGSTISTFATVLWPLDVEAHVNREFSRTDPCSGLEGEEASAAFAAADEAGRVTWPWHLLNVAVGGVYFAIVGFGTHRWDDAAWDGLSAFAIGEAQLLTQPTRLASRLDVYREARRAPLNPSLTAFVAGPGNFQIRLGLTF